MNNKLLAIIKNNNEEFDIKFPHEIITYIDTFNGLVHDKKAKELIKSYIQQSRIKELEALYQDLVETINYNSSIGEDYQYAYQDLCEKVKELREIIKELKNKIKV